MRTFYDLTNKEIEKLIWDNVKSEKKRSILYDRFVGGMLCSEIVYKHFPEFEFLSHRAMLKKCQQIKKMILRFNRVINKYIGDQNDRNNEEIEGSHE